MDDRLDGLLVDFAAALVRLPSVLGREQQVARRTIAEMQFLGFDQVELDSAGNAVGIVEGGRPGPTLVLDAHMDTVDVMPRDAWSRDPFSGEVDGEKLWGRGASDMKGALAAMVYGVGALDRARLAGKVVVSASVREESIEGAALRMVMQRYGADFVVIGEASALDLVRAGRGRAEMRLEVPGRPAHASSPHLGVNAVHRMRAAIEAVEALPMPCHGFVGNGVMCLTDIISVPFPAHSVVPSACRATYERRLLPGETEEQVLAEVLGACERAGIDDARVRLARADVTTYTGIRWEEPKWYAPWELSEEHELVQRAQRGLKAAGQSPALSAYQFCTNAAYSAGHAGVPTIGYGPGSEAMAHVVDESLKLAELLAAARGYAAIAGEVLAG